MGDDDPRWECGSFSQPRVRSRLERLMGTSVVRITDRNYMQKLQTRIREDHEESVRKRIHDREVGEVEREKHLILEGKMAVEEAPEELANHPVFKITQMTNKILEERRLQAEAKSMNKLMKKLKNYELSLPEKKEEEETEVEKCIELDEEEIARAKKLQEIEENISAGALFTQEDYDRIKYENPLVKQLRDVEQSVDELYKLADQIVGPIEAKKR
ncbi:uncharacterized protein LOC129001878 isoform X1 [Macrosteles quadrilineatus]|uniref:uncharacterized protein LOC129001878 isoform X1 n=1 Tax=Macrosteles quadrilineatus TaxID=74068 RepID=UPI0023E27134|nr:uncharacterized protein LOC129001878 isoform X1 [Macrosteles quadrilineatus]